MRVTCPTPRCQKYRSPRRGGFTLVETIVAVLVAGLAFVSLLGLIAISLTMMTEARDETVVSVIASQELTALESARRSEISEHVRYFDYEGERLEGEEGAVFVTRIVIDDDPADTVMGPRQLSKVTLSVNRTNPNAVPRFYHLWVANSEAGL